MPYNEEEMKGINIIRFEDGFKLRYLYESGNSDVHLFFIFEEVDMNGLSKNL